MQSQVKMPCALVSTYIGFGLPTVQYSSFLLPPQPSSHGEADTLFHNPRPARSSNLKLHSPAQQSLPPSPQQPGGEGEEEEGRTVNFRLPAPPSSIPPPPPLPPSPSAPPSTLSHNSSSSSSSSVIYCKDEPPAQGLPAQGRELIQLQGKNAKV